MNSLNIFLGWYCEIVYYRIVIDTLKDVDPQRKCFRMIGGILVERTAGEALPALQHNYEQVKMKNNAAAMTS